VDTAQFSLIGKIARPNPPIPAAVCADVAGQPSAAASPPATVTMSRTGHGHALEHPQVSLYFAVRDHSLLAKCPGGRGRRPNRNKSQGTAPRRDSCCCTPSCQPAGLGRLSLLDRLIERRHRGRGAIRDPCDPPSLNALRFEDLRSHPRTRRHRERDSYAPTPCRQLRDQRLACAARRAGRARTA
jgi:hypothetical protein